jgi:hypothetical protein
LAERHVTAIAAVSVDSASVTTGEQVTSSMAPGETSPSGFRDTFTFQGTSQDGAAVTAQFAVARSTGSPEYNILGRTSGDDQYKITVEKVTT